MIRKFCIAVLLAAVAAPVAATAPDTDKPSEEKMICKREIATGSIMARRTCHTKAEWQALEAKGKADLDRVRAMERSRSLVNDNR